MQNVQTQMFRADNEENLSATLAEKNHSKPPDCNVHLFIYLNIT